MADQSTVRAAAPSVWQRFADRSRVGEVRLEQAFQRRLATPAVRPGTGRLPDRADAGRPARTTAAIVRAPTLKQAQTCAPVSTRAPAAQPARTFRPLGSAKQSISQSIPGRLPVDRNRTASSRSPLHTARRSDRVPSRNSATRCADDSSSNASIATRERAGPGKREGVTASGGDANPPVGGGRRTVTRQQKAGPIDRDDRDRRRDRLEAGLA
jgi:hypothetical protein